MKRYSRRIRGDQSNQDVPVQFDRDDETAVFGIQTEEARIVLSQHQLRELILFAYESLMRKYNQHNEEAKER